MFSSDDESTDEEEVLRDFNTEAQLIIQTETLPKKSAERYILVYNTYKKWQMEHKHSISSSEESNLVVYFKELSEKLKPSTLWSIWSMLKKTLNTRDNVDINKFQNLKSLIKKNSKGYKPKKSLVLKWNEIIKFINNAPDYIYLVSKIILVFGICGALRCDELANLKVQDIEDLGNRYLVSISETKTDKPRQFIIGELFYEKIKQYISLKPSDSFTDRFFIQYQKGKCHQQVIGRNKIGETPQGIASYLNLPNPKLFTGHCYRRTGATLSSNSGASTTMLKQLGGWKSTNIAQENSMINRQKIYESITHTAASDTQSNPQPSTNKNCSSEIIIPNKNNESTNITVDWNNFFDDFEINDEDLTAIDQLNQPEAPKLFKPYFTTPKNRSILVNCNRQSTVPKDFTTKSPVIVAFKGSENEPPLKKCKITKAKTHTSEQTSQSSPCQKVNNNKDVNLALKTNPHNKYENCVFHGNITNNFYCSCNNYKN